jgi:uncharacterized protein DUF4249
MIPGRRCWVVASGVIVALGACDNLENPTSVNPPRLVVHAVFDTHSSAQTILVYRARTGDETSDTPVSGAEVSVRMPDGAREAAVSFDDSTGHCCIPGAYVLLERALPGAHYALSVRTPAGEEVSGVTTVPTAPAQLLFSPPFAPFDPLRDTVRLSWPRVPGARSYEVLVSSHAAQYRTFTDTAVSLPGTLLTITGDTVFPVHSSITVLVSAVDSNYYDYYRAQTDPFAGVPPGHLSGALGVFGSVAPILAQAVQVR